MKSVIESDFVKMQDVIIVSLYELSLFLTW